MLKPTPPTRNPHHSRKVQLCWHSLMDLNIRPKTNPRGKIQNDEKMKSSESQAFKTSALTDRRPSVCLTCDQDYWEGQHCSACGVSVSGHSPIVTMTVSMSGLLVITESTQLTTLGSGSGPSSDHLEAPQSSLLRPDSDTYIARAGRWQHNFVTINN